MLEDHDALPVDSSFGQSRGGCLVQRAMGGESALEAAINSPSAHDKRSAIPAVDEPPTHNGGRHGAFQAPAVERRITAL